MYSQRPEEGEETPRRLAGKLRTPRPRPSLLSTSMPNTTPHRSTNPESRLEPSLCSQHPGAQHDLTLGAQGLNLSTAPPSFESKVRMRRSGILNPSQFLKPRTPDPKLLQEPRVPSPLLHQTQEPRPPAPSFRPQCSGPPASPPSDPGVQAPRSPALSDPSVQATAPSFFGCMTCRSSGPQPSPSPEPES